MPKVSKQSLPKHKTELIIEVSLKELDKHLTKAAVKLSSEKPPAGFRPGKVDRDTAVKIYGEMALLEASLDFIVRDTLPEAIRQEKIEFIFEPQISVIKCAPNNPVIYKAILSLRPTVTLGNYKDIKLIKKQITIEDKQVEAVLRELLESRAKEAKVIRPAKLGDRVKLNIDMYLDKVPLDGGQIKEQQMILGRNDLWEGFSVKLSGTAANDIKEFSIDIPKNHPQKNIAGKKIDFKVKIHEIFERELPKADDSFAESLGGFKTLEELKKQINNNLTKEAEIKERQRLEGEILQKLVSMSSFSELSDILITNEKHLLLAETKDMIERQGLKWEDYLGHLKKNEEELLTGWHEPAIDRIKKNLILSALAKQEKIEVTDEDIAAEWREAQKHNPDMAGLEERDKERAKVLKNHIKAVLQNRKVLQKMVLELSLD